MTDSLSHIVISAEASAEQVFGPGSQRIVAQSVVPPDLHPFSDQSLFQGAVLVVALGYCLLLLRYLPHAARVVNILRGRIYTGSLLEEANHSLHLFLRLTTLLGLPATALGVVRVGEWWDGAAIAAALPAWATMLAVPFTTAVLALVMLYRKLLPAIAGSATLSRPFTHKLSYLRTIVTALGSLFTTPVMLLAALYHGRGEGVIIGVLVGLWIAGAGLLLFKTRQLFLSAGASILHWFSYLCAVEIFPLTLIAGIATRGN